MCFGDIKVLTPNALSISNHLIHYTFLQHEMEFDFPGIVAQTEWKTVVVGVLCTMKKDVYDT